MVELILLSDYELSFDTPMTGFEIRIDKVRNRPFVDNNSSIGDREV